MKSTDSTSTLSCHAHDPRARAWALAATVVAHLVLLLILLYTFLSYPRPGMEDHEPLQPDPLTFIQPQEIDYDFDPAVIDHIMAGEAIPDVQPEQDYGSPIPDAEDAGSANSTLTPVASPAPSPVEAKPEPSRNEAVSKNISNRTGNAFGAKTKGDPEQVKDQSRSLTLTIANSPAARSDKVGKIVFQVNVKGDGTVSGNPTLLRDRCEGDASQDNAIIARCRTEAARQRFAVIAGSPNQLGTVTFTFTDRR